MLVQTNRKYIFISIPKNATHTVHGMLGLPRPKEFSSPDDPGILDNHATTRVLKSRYGETEFTSRFKFSFVRNPWDRCVSWYTYHKKWPPYRGMSFAQWIEAGMPTHWDGDIQNGTRYQAPETSPLLQSSFICDESGRIDIDFVGRIENFAADMKHVCTLLGIQQPPQAQKWNVSRRHKDYKLYYTRETRALVSKQLHADIELFGYEW